MSGGEPSSIKRDHPCAARTPAPQLRTEELFFTNKLKVKGGTGRVPGAVPQVAAQNLYRGHRPEPHHRYPPPGRWRRGAPRTPISSRGRAARARRPARSILAKAINCLHPVDGEPCNECEACRGIDEGTLLDIHGARRRVEQRRRPRPRPARGGGLYPGGAEKARVHHRRGAHALNPGVQCAAEDSRGAAGASGVHPRDDGAAQGAGDDSLPVPAVFVQANSAARHGKAPAARRGGGAD